MTIAPTSMFMPAGVQTVRPSVETTDSAAADSPADVRARWMATAVGQGNESAFRELYEGYQGRMFRLALVLARGDEALAQDAVQGALVIAARKLRGAESADHLWNWLARATRQQLIKLWRQRRAETCRVEIAEMPDCPIEMPADATLESSLEVVLRTLPPEDRDVINWFYFEGMSHKEIADRLRTTPKAVSSRLERLRVKLRAAMARQLSDEA